jgi:hypothetical protein
VTTDALKLPQAIFIGAWFWYHLRNMKLLSISLMVFIFVVIPLYMLDMLVMPELRSWSLNYSRAEAIAQQINNQAQSQTSGW